LTVLSYPAVSAAQSDSPPSGKQILPAISWGASSNLAYNAAGGAATSAGPFSTGVIRLALSSGNVYLAIGSTSGNAQSALNPGTLIMGPGIEFVAIPNGWYLAAISEDTGTGSINITSAVSNENDFN
jgi:hypothetical protein